MANSYKAGNTIRFQGSFFDFGNKNVDPELVKVIIYDYKYNKFKEFILNSTNKISTGVYFYDYITSNEDCGKKFYYEFYGEIGGKPSLNRGDFVVSFI